MGGQARTGNNATASIGGYAEKRLALLTNATETTIATIKIDVMNAAVAPSIIPPYEHSIALISNGGTVNRNGTIVDEMGKCLNNNKAFAVAALHCIVSLHGGEHFAIGTFITFVSWDPFRTIF